MLAKLVDEPLRFVVLPSGLFNDKPAGDRVYLWLFADACRLIAIPFNKA